MTRLHRQIARALHATRVVNFLGRAAAWEGVLAVAYHRVGAAGDSPFDHGLWSASPEGFDQQVACLKRECDVIAPADLDDAVRRRRGRFAALITFDDGYRDNYEQAFPVLRSHNVPAVFFVATGFVDGPVLPWWDEIAWMVRSSPRRSVTAGRWFPADVAFDDPGREGAIRTLLRKYKSLAGNETEAYVNFLADATASGRYGGDAHRHLWMTWDMLREMKAGGMCVAGHTVNHPVLARLPKEQQLREIAGCRARIEDQLGGDMRWFSYPVGGPDAFNDDTRACLREAGITTAFSYYGGFRRFCDPWDWHNIPRVAVETDVSADQFQAIVSLPRAFARPRC